MVIRRVIIPAITVALVCTASLRTLSSASLPGSEYSACQTSLLHGPDPASDIVFFGSSRTGAAIDAAIITASMAGGETAEKVVYTLGSEIDRDLALRTYLRERGAPQIVALELSFERVPARVDEGPLPVSPSERSAAFFSAARYRELVESLLSTKSVGLGDVFLRQRIWNPLRYNASRVEVGWDLASRNPHLAFAPASECSWNFGPRKGRWVVGNALPWDSDVSLPSEDLLSKWRRQARRFRDFDPTDPWSRLELVMLRDMVSTAKAAGVGTVLLYYLPSYGERTTAMDLGKISEMFPDALVWDGRGILSDESRPGLAQQYNDMNHVNRIGAGEISFALIDTIDRVLRPRDMGAP